jgi:pyruvate kinase
MAEARRSFSIDVKVGESVTIDRGRVVVTVLEKSGKTAKLGFDAEKDVPINKQTAFPSGAAQARKGIRP